VAARSKRRLVVGTVLKLAISVAILFGLAVDRHVVLGAVEKPDKPIDLGSRGLAKSPYGLERLLRSYRRLDVKLTGGLRWPFWWPSAGVFVGGVLCARSDGIDIAVSVKSERGMLATQAREL
jgi:hypothetical protein